MLIFPLNQIQSEAAKLFYRNTLNNQETVVKDIKTVAFTILIKSVLPIIGA